MAGRIPQSFIDDLLGRVDIVDVIETYVPLTRAGREWKACCPFHAEKTPSFTVVPGKQFYHCFGCQAHGTAIGFLMDYAQLDFVEAVEDLARRAGIDVPREGGATAEDRSGLEPLYDTLARASTWFQRQLRAHPRAGEAVDYLRGRGITGEVAKAFRIGFAPPGWSNLADDLGADAASRERLEQVGLLARRDNGGHYDRLRARIVFPILDRRGRTVGFGGRVIDPEDSPKYLNSPETPVFHKGRELYGLYQIRSRRERPERIVVVEGYMDVVALAQHGVDNAVAALGTAATIEHLETLFRNCRDVVFCFDGDAAGRRAAWRALETALAQMRDGRQASFMFLPDGDDPDTLVRREGRAAFEARVETATTLGTYLFDHLLESADLDTIDGRSRLHASARELIDRLPAGAFRDLAFGRLGELTGLHPRESSTLDSERRRPGVAPGPRPTAPAGSGGRSPVRQAITMLLRHGALAGNLEDVESLRGVDLPGVDLLTELIEMLRVNPHLPTAAVIERFRGRDAHRHLSRLVADRNLEPLADDVNADPEQLAGEFRECIRQIALIPDEIRYEALSAKGLGRLSPEEVEEYRMLSRKVSSHGRR